MVQVAVRDAVKAPEALGGAVGCDIGGVYDAQVSLLILVLHSINQRFFHGIFTSYSFATNSDKFPWK